MSKRKVLAGLTTLAALVLLIGCSGDPVSSDGASLSVMFRDNAGTGGSAAKVDAVDNVTVTDVKVVLGRIILEGDSGDTIVFRSAEHEPLVLDLDLSGNAQRVGVVAAAPGAYTRTLFRIARLEPTDSAAYANYPDMQGISIRVEGYVNGSPDSSFVFTSQLDEEQQRTFSTALNVVNGGYQIEFQFNHNNWFIDDQSVFIDPRVAQIASSRSQVETNIVDGFDMYHP